MTGAARPGDRVGPGPRAGRAGSPGADGSRPGRPAEEPLSGGFVAEVVRAGDTVRRTPPARADFVAALLAHLDRAGCDLAPRPLGTDEHGRQVLTYLDGRVPWRDREDPSYFSDAALVRLAELIRWLHDACAGSPLAGDAETVCHRDLSPKNTVYRDFPAGPLPVAFLDWDLAAPGRRVEDVAFAAWHWADLGAGADPVELGRRARLLCDAYDAAGPGRRRAARPASAPAARPGTAAAAPGAAMRAELIEVVLTQVEGTWRGIAAGARRDEPGMRRLREAGVVELVHGWHGWLLAHRPTVEAALR